MTRPRDGDRLPGHMRHHTPGVRGDNFSSRQRCISTVSRNGSQARVGSLRLAKRAGLQVHIRHRRIRTHEGRDDNGLVACDIA